MSRKGFANTHRFREWQKRHGDRLAAEGRRFEEEMERILTAMQERGLIHGFVRHRPLSRMDHQGCDFTAVRYGENGEIISRSFGVTRSQNSWRRAKRTHPEVPQFCFPFGTNKETIERRVLGLFPHSSISINAAS